MRTVVAPVYGDEKEMKGSTVPEEQAACVALLLTFKRVKMRLAKLR